MSWLKGQGEFSPKITNFMTCLFGAASDIFDIRQFKPIRPKQYENANQFLRTGNDKYVGSDRVLELKHGPYYNLCFMIKFN